VCSIRQDWVRLDSEGSWRGFQENESYGEKGRGMVDVKVIWDKGK